MKLLILIYVWACQAWTQTTGNHHLATDTEVGSDGSVTQYVLYDYGCGKDDRKPLGISAMVLALRTADGSQFLEPAAGPCKHGRGWFLNTYFGGAKGGRFVAVLFGGVGLPGKLNLTIASDPKLPVGNISRAPEIWFTRAWLGWDKLPTRNPVLQRIGLKLRHDNLQEAGKGSIDAKAGGQILVHVTPKTEVYSFGYRDYRQPSWGFTFGVNHKFF